MSIYNITQTIEGQKVKYKRPSIKFYEAIGGKEGMEKFMSNFYDIVFKSDIHNFFPQDKDEFEEVKKKNTKFFIQLCGGPKVYEEESKGMDLDEYMIRIHDDFSISDKARIEWLGCMKEALESVDMDDEIKKEFWDYCEKFSKLTVNSFPKKDFNPYF